MNDLVIMKDQQAVTSSLQVAENFDKEHSKVMRAIEGIAKNGDTILMTIIIFLKANKRVEA